MENKFSWTLVENGSPSFGHQVLGPVEPLKAGSRLIIHEGHDLQMARLVAAAPKLLEACKALLEPLSNEEINECPQYAAAKAAIALAEGKN